VFIFFNTNLGYNRRYKKACNTGRWFFEGRKEKNILKGQVKVF
jgi:hypothetical protein